MSRKKIILRSSILALGLCMSFSLFALPMMGYQKLDVPAHLSGYKFLVDSNDENLLYLPPRQGFLGVVGRQPQLSFAKIVNPRDQQTYGWLNIMYDFAIPAEHFSAIKAAAQKAGKKITPLPFVRTRMELAVAGYDEGEKAGLCATEVGTDAFGNETEQSSCLDIVFKSKYSKNGPTLGEKFSVSLILTPAGTLAFRQMMAEGFAFGVKMNAVYMQAFPAYTAKIHVKWEKLKESMSSFFALHDGRCIDIELSDYWQKEMLCGEKMVDGRTVRENLNGRDCSVIVTLTDNHGKEVKNIWTQEDLLEKVEGNEKEYAEWVNKYSEELKKFHNMTEGLREKFEKEMLSSVDIREAGVSKEKRSLVTYRRDYVKKEMRKEFTVTRKTLGRSITRRTTIPSAIGCIDVADDGIVTPILNRGVCERYWKREISPLGIIPVATGIDAERFKREGGEWIKEALDWN